MNPTPPGRVACRRFYYVFGMNPSAIGRARLIVSTRLIEPLKESPQHAAVIERKIGALQKCHARSARFYALKHSYGHLENIRDEEKMKSSGANWHDYVLKSGKLLGRARNSEETLHDAA